MYLKLFSKSILSLRSKCSFSIPVSTIATLIPLPLNSSQTGVTLISSPKDAGDFAPLL
jgi:hypothetical protein